MIPSGAPALTAASRTTLAAAIVLPLALGCGLMMIPFLVFNEMSVDDVKKKLYHVLDENLDSSRVKDENYSKGE